MGLSLQVFLWCLFKVRSLLSKSFLPYWASPFLVLETAGFSRGIIFVCVKWHFWNTVSSSTQSGIHEAKRKLKELTTSAQSSDKKVPRQSAFSPPHSLFSVCFTYNVQGLELYLVGEIRRIESICSKPELYSCLLSSFCNWVVTISQLSFVSKANVQQPGTHLQGHTISRDKMFPGTWQPMSHMLFIC